MKKFLSIILALSLVMSFTAFASDGDSSVIESDIAVLTSDSLLTAPLVDGEYLVDSLRLPTKGMAGSDIVWDSSNKDVINTNGTLVRPANESVDVTLTATLSYGSAHQTATFNFKVAPLNMPMEGIDNFGSLSLYKGSDFSDNNWYDAAVFPVAALIPEVSDGVGVQNTETRFYWGTKTGYSEFIIKRSNPETINIKPMENNGTGLKLSLIQWFDNTFRYYYGKPEAHKDIALDLEDANTLKVGIYVNVEEAVYSLWLNNELVANRIEMTVPNGYDMQSVNVNCNIPNNVKFEEYRFYNVVPIDDETAMASVTADAQALTIESLLTAPLTSDGYLLDSLVLPVKGENYSDISWECSNDAVIGQYGTLTRPAHSIEDVVLTATIKRGSVSQEKSFKFKVAPLDMAMEGISDFGMLSLYKGSDFSDNNWYNASVFPVTNMMPIVNNGKGTCGTQTRLYWDNAKRTDNVYAEFVMTRTSDETVRIDVYNNVGSGKKLMEVQWNDDGTVSSKTFSSDRSYKDNLKIGIYIDVFTGKYSLWLDNKLVCKNLDVKLWNDDPGFQVICLSTATSDILQLESYAFYSVEYSYRAISEFDSYKTSFYAPEFGNTHDALNCYLAIYDGNTLVDVKFSSIQAGACDGRRLCEIEFSEDELSEYVTSNLTSKAFMWSDDGKNKPLSSGK